MGYDLAWMDSLPECSKSVVHIFHLTKHLHYINNEPLAQGNVPDDCRHANVSTVDKKGEKYEAANYRPVSLTCICCKPPEHILMSNINKQIALDSILADCQHGFRSRRVLRNPVGPVCVRHHQ